MDGEDVGLNDVLVPLGMTLVFAAVDQLDFGQVQTSVAEDSYLKCEAFKECPQPRMGVDLPRLPSRLPDPFRSAAKLLEVTGNQSHHLNENFRFSCFD